MVSKKKTTKKVTSKKTTSKKRKTSKKKTVKAAATVEESDEETVESAVEVVTPSVPARDMPAVVDSVVESVSVEGAWAKEAAKEAKNCPNHVLIKLSKQLKSRLKQTADSEGVAVDDLVEELLAESIVLRAWEIMQQKGAMRGESGNSSGFGGNRVQGGGSNYRPQQNQRSNNQRSNNQRGGRHNSQNRNRQQGGGNRYNNNNNNR